MIETNAEAQTLALGRCFGLYVKPGTVITLDGALGVGKTVFTKGVAGGIGIPEPVTSPTFTILQSYESGRLPFYHFDVYRIGDIEEMEEIGYEDCFYGEGVSLVEWAELIRELIPREAYAVVIEKDCRRGMDYRKIKISHPTDSLAWLADRKAVLENGAGSSTAETADADSLE